MNTTKPKVLIVDDDPITLKVLTNFLEPTYTVVNAESGEKAWQLLTELPYNFATVITDRMMPGMDGIELTRKMQLQPAFKKIPVIMLTSNAQKREVIDAIQGGVYDFLMKPIEKDLLLLVVKRALVTTYS